MIYIYIHIYVSVGTSFYSMKHFTDRPSQVIWYWRVYDGNYYRTIKHIIRITLGFSFVLASARRGPFSSHRTYHQDYILISFGIGECKTGASFYIINYVLSNDKNLINIYSYSGTLAGGVRTWFLRRLKNCSSLLSNDL